MNKMLDFLNKQNINSSNNDNHLPTSLDDPRMDKVKSYAANHGGNPKAAFYQLCREKMLNPTEVLNKFFGR